MDCLLELSLNRITHVVLQSLLYLLVAFVYINHLNGKLTQIHLRPLIETDLKVALEVLVSDGDEFEFGVIGTIFKSVHFFLDEFGDDLVILYPHAAFFD